MEIEIEWINDLKLLDFIPWRPQCSWNSALVLLRVRSVCGPVFVQADDEECKVSLLTVSDQALVNTEGLRGLNAHMSAAHMKTTMQCVLVYLYHG